MSDFYEASSIESHSFNTDLQGKAYSRKGKPSSTLAEGHVREDYRYVIGAGLNGIHESMIQAPLIIQKSIHSAKPYPALYKGKLGTSFKRKYTRKGGIVYSNVKYAAIIEDGMKPGSLPPYRDIAKWVAYKTGAPRSMIKKAEAASFAIMNNSKGKKKKMNSGPFQKFKRTKKRKEMKRNVVRFAAMVAGLRLKIKKDGIAPRKYASSVLKQLADITLILVMKHIDSKRMSVSRLPTSGKTKMTSKTGSNSYINTGDSFLNSDISASSYDVEFSS